MGFGTLIRQFFASRKDRLAHENVRMVAFVQSETASAPIAAAGPLAAAQAGSGPIVQEETITRPDGSVMHTRVERHEEFRVVGPDGSVTVYDRWEDLPPEIQAALKRPSADGG